MRAGTGLLGTASLLLAASTVGCGASADREGGDLEIGKSRNALSTILENNTEFANATGRSSSFSTAGSVDLTGSFFQNLGTNGRTCNTCHLASDGWTVSAASAQRLFEE